MKIADFEKNLKQQKPEYHIKFLSDNISEKYNISKDKIGVFKFPKEISNIDRIFYWMGEGIPMTQLLEFKTCEKAYETGNMVVEIVTGTTEEAVEGFKSNNAIYANSPLYPKAIKLINNVKCGKINGKLCYGILNGKELYENMFLSYLILDSEKKPWRLIKIECKALSEYCWKNRRDLPLYMTVSKGNDDKRWGAVGFLLKYEKIIDEDFVEILLWNEKK